MDGMVSPKSESSRGCLGSLTVLLLLSLGTWVAVRDLVAPDTLIPLSVGAALLLTAGFYLLRGVLKEGVPGSFWTGLRAFLGLFLVGLGSLAFLPRAPVSLVERSPFGRQVLEHREVLLKEAVAAEDLEQIRRLAVVGVGNPRPRDSFGNPLLGETDDPEMLRLTMRVMGTDAATVSGLALVAARRALLSDSFEIDETTAGLILAYFTKNVGDPYSINGKKFHGRFRERYKDYETLARSRLHKGPCKQQVHPSKWLGEHFSTAPPLEMDL